MPNVAKPTNVKLEVDDFLDVFKPIQNPIESDAPFDGCMFETFGAELDYVTQYAKTNPDHVWTIFDVDGRQIINNGVGYVNRMGYLITEKAAAPNTHYEVFDPDEEDLDD